MDNRNCNTVGKKTKYRTFIDFPSAFDYVREINKPQVVLINPPDDKPDYVYEKWKLYPSGRADYIEAVLRDAGVQNG